MQQSQALAKTQDFYSMKKLLINSIFTFFWPVEGQAVHDPEETGSHKLKWKGFTCHLLSWHVDYTKCSLMTPWMHSIESKAWLLLKQRISSSLEWSVLHSKLAQPWQKNSFFTPLNLICSYYAKKVDLHCQSSDQVSLHNGGLFQESPIHCLLCPHTCRNTDLHTCHPSTILLVFTGRCKIHWTNIEEEDKQERVLHILHDWRANQETEQWRSENQQVWYRL